MLVVLRPAAAAAEAATVPGTGAWEDALAVVVVAGTRRLVVVGPAGTAEKGGAADEDAPVPLIDAWCGERMAGGACN